MSNTGADLLREREAATREHEFLKTEISATRQALNDAGTDATEPLVTPDGFPRADIDVYTVRHLRAKLIRLENDLNASTDRMQAVLNRFFQLQRQTSGDAAPTQRSAPRTTRNGASIPTSGSPASLGVVRSVVSGTLGDKHGIEKDDQILAFGDANSLAEFPQELAKHKDSGSASLRIKIYRPKKEEELTVHMQVPSGQSLGLHIVPN